MTEAQWLARFTPLEKLLAYLPRHAGPRKLRLFACACVRRAERLLPDARGRRALRTAERYAAGLAAVEELRAAEAEAEAALAGAATEADRLPLDCVAAAVSSDSLLAGCDAALDAARSAAWAVGYAACRGGGGKADAARRREQARQRRLLWDLAPNPFRPAPAAPAAWLAWHGGTVPRLARAASDGRAFERLPVLADAVEEAGCTDAPLLGHLRGPGPHARGCWALDLLLGRE
jgi:hypothetical protein